MFEGSRLNSATLVSRIKHIISYQRYVISPKVTKPRQGHELLPYLNVKPSTIRTRVLWVSWTYPADGLLKLNVDGSVKRNPGCSGGGAVLRNQRGQLVLVASRYYGIGTNMAAELYHNFGLSKYQLIIETDSQILMNMVKDQFKCSWKYWPLIYQLHQLLHALKFEINHIYREANSVADFLANQGVEDRADKEYVSASMLSAEGRNLLLQDQLQLRSLHRKYCDASLTIH